MMPTWAPSPEDLPHLAALNECFEKGFRFLLLRDAQNQLVAIHAARHSGGAVDTVAIASFDQAIAARTREADYPNGHPLWQTTGAPADAIGALLELPPHGSPGAPMIALGQSLLWRPGER